MAKALASFFCMVLGLCLIAGYAAMLPDDAVSAEGTYSKADIEWAFEQRDKAIEVLAKKIVELEETKANK